MDGREALDYRRAAIACDMFEFIGLCDSMSDVFVPRSCCWVLTSLPAHFEHFRWIFSRRDFLFGYDYGAELFLLSFVSELFVELFVELFGEHFLEH